MSDSIQPTDLTVDPQGNIGAVFTGHVVAHGVDLPESYDPFLLGPANFVDWKDAGGVVREEIAGEVNESGEHVLILRANPGQTDVAEIAVAGGDVGGGSAAEIVAVARHQFRTLLNAAGESAFVQNPGGAAGQVYLANGTFSLTYGAGQTQSNGTVIAHPLGVTPSAILLGQLGNEGSRLTSLRATEVGPNLFTAWGNATAAFPTQVTFPYCWLAIG